MLPPLNSESAGMMETSGGKLAIRRKILARMIPSFAFLLPATLLAVTPGPGIAYVVARTVAGGRAEGMASCIGTALGGIVHVVAAACGLSMLITQSAIAFAIVKSFGAAY